jgi:GNAT superfamily N-acetyltransferase
LAVKIDNIPVWSISCFYIRKGYRKQGISKALISAAIDAATRAGAPALEAYPVDASMTSTTSHTGYVSTFTRAGFVTHVQHAPARPTMRLSLYDMPIKHIPTIQHQPGQINDKVYYIWKHVGDRYSLETMLS